MPFIDLSKAKDDQNQQVTPAVGDQVQNIAQSGTQPLPPLIDDQNQDATQAVIAGVPDGSLGGNPSPIQPGGEPILPTGQPVAPDSLPDIQQAVPDIQQATPVAPAPIQNDGLPELPQEVSNQLGGQQLDQQTSEPGDNLQPTVDGQADLTLSDNLQPTNNDALQLPNEGNPQNMLDAQEVQQGVSVELPSDTSLSTPPNPTPDEVLQQNTEKNEIPVAELNSLNIDDDSAGTTGLDANDRQSPKNLNIEVDDNGVKTMTGPAMNMNIPISAADLETENEAVQQGQENNAQQEVVLDKSKGHYDSGDASASIEGMTGLLPADTHIDVLCDLAKERDASDIHVTANYPVMLRVDGKLIPVTEPLTPEQSRKIVEDLMSEDQKKAFEEKWELDFSYTNPSKLRFRVNTFTERENVGAAMRLIATKIRSMEELGLPPIFKELIKEPHGLILLVGPTGSGKSTTLAAMLNDINLNRREHIITIEDPIEYVYPIGKSIVDQREIGADTKSFLNALKSALRQDPNVVLVGEMRDLDTISATITIAETGHLVFATLHTNSASQAIDRIIDVFPEGAKEQIRAQLANVITAVISQRLVPIQGGGRRAAIEIMLGTVAVKNAIREGKTYQIDNIIQTSGDLGMVTIEKSLVEMVKEGYITKETAMEWSVKPEDIESLLSQT